MKVEAERLFAQVAPARERSSLKEAPDADAANAVLMEIHQRILGLSEW